MAKTGVIDIGSNSVRLVVYDGLKRCPLPLFNEKILSGLGASIAADGKLAKDKKEDVKRELGRFLILAREMGVEHLATLATSAVRDASDGQAFVRELEAMGMNVTVLSGDKEAELAALGVRAAFFEPEGMVGDLGGGSFELVSVQKDRLDQTFTLPIGTLRLPKNRSAREKLLEAELKEVKKQLPKNVGRFYAIGGSFRALAKYYMEICSYPLNMVHGLTLKTEEFLRFVHEVAELDPSETKGLPGISMKRAPNLPMAASSIDAVLAIVQPKEIMFSAAGIREGYLFSRLEKSLQLEDPLLASARNFAAREGLDPDYSKALFEWLEPLCADESAKIKRIRSAFCVFSEAGLRVHPDYRASWAHDSVLLSEFWGMLHEERVLLALMLYHRYRSKFQEGEVKEAPLISEKKQKLARLIGTAAHLAFVLSGGSAKLLRKVPLVRENGELLLKIPSELVSLCSEEVEKRLEKLKKSAKEDITIAA